MAKSHGLSNSPEHNIWGGIIQRCTNPNRAGYQRYGGRGISIYPEWRQSFTAFLKYIGPRPSPKHTVDRWPDNDGNYEPGNVRWATPAQQNRSDRPPVEIEAFGLRKTPLQWSSLYGVNKRTIASRFLAGVPAELAVTTKGTLRGAATLRWGHENIGKAKPSTEEIRAMKRNAARASHAKRRGIREEAERELAEELEVVG